MCKRVQEFIKWVVIIMIVIIIGQELYFLPNFGNKEVRTQLVVVDKNYVITRVTFMDYIARYLNCLH